MNNNLQKLSVRRYAVQLGSKGLPASTLERPQSLNTIKNANIHQDVGKPIHAVIHHAMADAFHHLGLSKGSGQEQYQAFANLRDRANKELSNPNSKFTKLFNKHKNELSQVPNPREHLTDALLPLFHNLSQYEEVPQEQGPIDLLGSGHHHPFENIGPAVKSTSDDRPGGTDEVQGFEYKPRLPPGFVEVPNEDHKELTLHKPKTKRKAYPHRNDVYKSIAEHEDMGWSAPNKLKEYLVQKHNITPQEASVHIGNWKRKQKKPTASTPKESKRVWPPIQRKSRNTDLMAIPKRYTKAPKGDCHEITLDDNEPEVSEEPIKKEAFRAPAKGIIIRGTAYTGGQMIPDLGSSFMNPRRKAIK